MSFKSNNQLSVVPYEPPEWASHLTCIPKQRVVLAATPTPMYRWNIPNLPNGFELYIKRDDMTGSTLSGNKVRKLEFLLGEAVAQGYKSVMTWGSIYSNHCRATAIAAKELSLDCHLMVAADNLDQNVVNNPGNLLPILFTDTNLYIIPEAHTQEKVQPMEEKLVKKIREETGCVPYCIPAGGSNEVGLFGYINAWQEMMNDDDIFSKCQDIVLACGSGGVLAGVAVANFLTGQKFRIHGISISLDKQYLCGHINEMLAKVGISNTKAEDIVDVTDCHVGCGYSCSTCEDRELYLEISAATGVVCDPIYVGKAVHGMLWEMKNNPSRFKGNKILFIHTGGMYGLYSGEVQTEVKEKFKKNAYIWPKDESTYTSLFQ